MKPKTKITYDKTTRRSTTHHEIWKTSTPIFVVARVWDELVGRAPSEVQLGRLSDGDEATLDMRDLRDLCELLPEVLKQLEKEHSARFKHEAKRFKY